MQNHTKLTIKELPKTKKASIDSNNPILKIQQAKFTTDQAKKLDDIANLYGSAMSMMLKYERRVLSQPQRLPGLRSSFLSLESHLGRLDKLDFEDVFNRDNNIMKVNPHDLYLSQFS